MAGRRIHDKYRYEIVRQVDAVSMLSRLHTRGAFNAVDESGVREIFAVTDATIRRQRSEDFLEGLLMSSSATSKEFQTFCDILDDISPKLLHSFLNPKRENDGDRHPASEALKLGYELALKERDEILREKTRALEERDDALKEVEQLRTEMNKNNSSSILLGKSENTTMDYLSPQKSRSSDAGSETGEQKLWQTFKVTLSKSGNYGFGIAVSGGRDNPHFTDGDPSIAISDVLKAGPAEGILRVNDRVTSANGISLENVEHSTAIAVLRDSNSTVNLVIKRRHQHNSPQSNETPPLNVTLNKRSKKDEFGVVLGCRYYIKEITSNSLAGQEGGLKEDDTILKINGQSLENCSFNEAKKLLEKVKDKLQLVITKKRRDSPHKRTNSNLPEETRDDVFNNSFITPKQRHPSADNVNIYRPLPRGENNTYKGIPITPNTPSVPSTVNPFFNTPYTDQSNDAGYFTMHGNPKPHSTSSDADAPPRPPLPVMSDSLPLSKSPAPNQLQSAPIQPGYTTDRLQSPVVGSNDALSPGDFMDAGFTRRHEERYVEKRRDIGPDPRKVCFRKDEKMGLGLRLAGGNITGIFIASVQTGSDAEDEGLTEGDEILQANSKDITGMTREEAVLYLTNLHGDVTMIVQYRKEDYDRIMASREAGDSFYIKTHCSHQQTTVGELGYDHSTIFHVKDTLYQGVVGFWIAIKIVNGEEMNKGIIPNLHRAEEIAIKQPLPSNETPVSPTRRTSSLFKKKGNRRTKSLGRNHWDDVIFSSYSSKFPAYDRVIFQHPGFMRPVIIYGPISDIARERLITDYPHNFQFAQESIEDSDDIKNQIRGGILRMGNIQRIISQNMHCVLDVTPHAIDRLEYSQYYPIVIHLKPDSKQSVKSVRVANGKISGKSPKKLMEQSTKLEDMYKHLFTGTVTHGSSDSWFHKLVETIQQQQRAQIWMSEVPPVDDNQDEVLFPMSGRDPLSPDDPRVHDPRSRMVRSSSDPSLSVMEKIPGIPPYPSPPSYANRPIMSQQQQSRSMYAVDRLPEPHPQNDMYPGQGEDRYYASYYGTASDAPRLRANIDPYSQVRPTSRQTDRPDHPGADPHYQRHPDSRHPDNKMRQSQSAVDVHHSMGDYAYTAPKQVVPNDSSSHSSDSYTKHINRPDNQHDDSKLNTLYHAHTLPRQHTTSNPSQDHTLPRQPVISVSHDPYRFTRSTTNPVNTSNVNKARLNDLSAKYRKDEKRSRANAPSPSRSSDSTVKEKRQPPPVPPKTYTLADRTFRNESYRRQFDGQNQGQNHYNPNFPVVTENGPVYNHQTIPDGYATIRPNRTQSPNTYVSHDSRSNLTVNGTHQANGTHPDETNPYDPYSRGYPIERQRTDYTDNYDIPPARRYNQNYYEPNQNFVETPTTSNTSNRPQSQQISMTTPVTNGNMSPVPTTRSSAFEDYQPPTQSVAQPMVNGMPEEGRRSKQTYHDFVNGPEPNNNHQQRSEYTIQLNNANNNDTNNNKKPPHDARPATAAITTDVRNDAVSVKSDGTRSEGLSTPETVIHVEGYDGNHNVDDNHQVVASAQGLFDSSGGVLESPETGVSLHIPNGAITQGTSEEIYFKVCKDSTSHPPLDKKKGETLLSPVVMCGPHGLKFNKPIELKLPQCASVSPESWSFALKCRDSPTEKNWQNVALSSEESRVDPKSVSVLIDHF